MTFRARTWRGSCLAILVLLGLSAVNSWSQVEPKAGQWKTWVLSSRNQLRLPAPPTATADKFRSIHDYLATPNSVALEQIAFWDAGSPTFRWIQIAAQELSRRNIAAPLATRALALISVAMYDATIAAWDSKYAYNRPRPSQVDPTIHPLVSNGGSPSYPSEHAVVAGAASAVLASLFPDGADSFNDLAEEAARSRLFAGTQQAIPPLVCSSGARWAGWWSNMGSPMVPARRSPDHFPPRPANGAELIR